MAIGGKNADKLLTDVICLFKCSKVEITIPAPLLISVPCLECVENIEHSNVIAVRVRKLSLLSV